MTIPLITNTSIRRPSSQRARNNSNALVRTPKPMQGKRVAPVSTVTTAPTVADDDNPATRLVNQVSARIAFAANRSGMGSPSTMSEGGDRPASVMDTRAAVPSRPSDISTDIAPTACSGTALNTPTTATTTITIAAHDAAVKVTTPQAVARFADTAVTAADDAASSTCGTSGAPGTAIKPATAASSVAITPNVNPAVGSR